MKDDRSDGRPAVDERWNRVFEALSARPRRRIITSLLDVPRERRVPLPDALQPSSLSMDRETLRTELRHRHLPKLADAGYVRWDADRLAVQRGPEFAEVAVVWETITASTDRYPPELVDGCPVLEDSF